MHLTKRILNCLFFYFIYPTAVLLAQTPTSLEDLDIFQLQYAGAPEISPEGDKIVYARHQFDIMQDKAFSNSTHPWSISQHHCQALKPDQTCGLYCGMV